MIDWLLAWFLLFSVPTGNRWRIAVLLLASLSWSKDLFIFILEIHLVKGNLRFPTTNLLLTATRFIGLTTLIYCLVYSESCMSAHVWLNLIIQKHTMFDFYYPPTKSEGYSFGVVRPYVHSVCLSVRTFCLSGTISQYLLARFNWFLVQMISIIDSWYPINLVKIDPLTLELLPLFKYRQL